MVLSVFRFEGTEVPAGFVTPVSLRARSRYCTLGLVEEDVVDFRETEQTDRRRTSRFPVERAVRYQMLSRTPQIGPGKGQTVNMSSSGVLISTEDQLPVGRKLEVSISWPAQLDDTCPLKLVATGKVVRVEPGRAALSIQKHEFRTTGSNAFE